MGSYTRSGLAALLTTLLVACSSLPIGTAGKLRGLDYASDDIASLLIAFDVPPGLEPVRGASELRLDITTPADGERHIRAVLSQADADELAGTLPPPSGDRNYYLFGFSATDQAAIREAQAWARTLPPGVARLGVSLTPGFCRTLAIDPARVNVSVLLALPGASRLSPLLSNQPLRTILDAAGIREVPPCQGDSG